MRKILMTLAVVGSAVGGTYAWRAHERSAVTAQEHDGRLVTDRMWLDHLPKHDRDPVQAFVAIAKKRRGGPQGPIGAFQTSTAWQGHFDLFRFEREGQEMRVIFPQTGERETLTVKASTCNEQGMDFCLDVTGNARGVHRYYSRKGWEVRDVAAADAIVTSLGQ